MLKHKTLQEGETDVHKRSAPLWFESDTNHTLEPDSFFAGQCGSPLNPQGTPANQSFVVTGCRVKSLGMSRHCFDFTLTNL